jgi:hypothetical protein
MKEHKILPSKDRLYLTGNTAEDVFISRIRIGHTRLSDEATSSTSATFVRKLWAIKHLLVDCTRYDGHRVRLLGNQGLSLVLAESEGATKRIVDFFQGNRFF